MLPATPLQPYLLQSSTGAPIMRLSRHCYTSLSSLCLPAYSTGAERHMDGRSPLYSLSVPAKLCGWNDGRDLAMAGIDKETCCRRSLSGPVYITLPPQVAFVTLPGLTRSRPQAPGRSPTSFGPATVSPAHRTNRLSCISTPLATPATAVRPIPLPHRCQR